MEQELVTEVLGEAERKMRAALEVLQREFAGMRTARASPALVERLLVDYYGSPTPLQQLAGITVPEARLVLIQPWDGSALPAIERAIQDSDLGVTPSSDGQVVRLVLPPLTEERRRELGRLAGRRVEEARVAVRNVRREAHADLRDMLKERMLTEDDLRWSEGRLQEITDQMVIQATQMGEEKEAEFLEA